MSDPTAGWLTIDEAAALIRVPKSWLYERTRLNTVPHKALGLTIPQSLLLRADEVRGRRPHSLWSELGRVGPARGFLRG